MFVFFKNLNKIIKAFRNFKFFILVTIFDQLFLCRIVTAIIKVPCYVIYKINQQSKVFLETFHHWQKKRSLQEQNERLIISSF